MHTPMLPCPGENPNNRLTELPGRWIFHPHFYPFPWLAKVHWWHPRYPPCISLFCNLNIEVVVPCHKKRRLWDLDIGGYEVQLIKKKKYVPWFERSLYFCMSLLKTEIRCVKNSSESCCFVPQNPWRPFPINALNWVGLIPCWNTGVGDGCCRGDVAIGVPEENWAGWEYRPLNNPSATLCIWHSTQSAGRGTVQVSAWLLAFSLYLFLKVGREKTIWRTEAI